MSESISALKSAIEETKRVLVNAMMKVVMEHGEDFHDSYDYYRNDFGIDEEETEENTKVLKIIDMFNNGGCCFSHEELYHIITPILEKESKTYWLTSAFWGLYVVVENNKMVLKYYLLYNEGMEYDSDVSEPDHGYAQALSLHELERLSAYLFDYVSPRKSI